MPWPTSGQYLVKQNRPYNATDLQANLKAKHNISKPSVVKILASLAAKGDIVEKVYGKQLIYAPKQVKGLPALHHSLSFRYARPNRADDQSQW